MTSFSLAIYSNSQFLIFVHKSKIHLQTVTVQGIANVTNMYLLLDCSLFHYVDLYQTLSELCLVIVSLFNWSCLLWTVWVRPNLWSCKSVCIRVSLWKGGYALVHSLGTGELQKQIKTLHHKKTDSGCTEHFLEVLFLESNKNWIKCIGQMPLTLKSFSNILAKKSYEYSRAHMRCQCDEWCPHKAAFFILHSSVFL